MTNAPILLPNARHRGRQNGTGSKTGLASLPPKPDTASSSRAGSASSERAPIYMGRTPPNRTSTMNTPSPGERNEASGEAGSESTPGFSSSTPVLQLPQNGLASSSTLKSATFSSKVLGKRPLSDIDQAEQFSSSSNPALTETSTVLTTAEQPRIIPILPTPLPSKRFKKGSQARASLVPVEQLPVFPLPPLPVITDPALEKQVFTHQSCFPRRKWRFEDPEDDPSLDYEKLEHVGDSILGMVVTTWLHELKPRLTCGRASKLKSHLVSNATLSHISGLYNLPQRLVGPPNQLPVLRAQTDVRAAMVEAYIAAIYFSHPAETRMTVALKIIGEWLRDMYEPLYDFFLNHMQADYDQHRTAIAGNPDGTVQTISNEEMARIDNASMGMAALVRVYGDKEDRLVRYEEERHDTNLGVLWSVKCVVDGIQLGEGTRASKQTAKNVAAWHAAKRLGLVTEE